jgi:hypothetical protein
MARRTSPSPRPTATTAVCIYSRIVFITIQIIGDFVVKNSEIFTTTLLYRWSRFAIM